MKQTIKSLLSFIKTSPSPYHTVLSSKAILEKSGFTELKEGLEAETQWQIFCHRF